MYLWSGAVEAQNRKKVSHVQPHGSNPDQDFTRKRLWRLGTCLDAGEIVAETAHRQTKSYL